MGQKAARLTRGGVQGRSRTQQRSPSRQEEGVHTPPPPPGSSTQPPSAHAPVHCQVPKLPLPPASLLPAHTMPSTEKKKHKDFEI